ncbi:FadR/GntR family transcriptional regulator [Parasphingorhabdus sp.]|uniref:FadR/GntR family transcriptional regulator n=1 Tax=Parasphingorhabdus sp. TaxID=2709688 RepID=UPI002B26B01D|nr:FCD domain-containing protein [Parasphingorhabdus sp.]
MEFKPMNETLASRTARALVDMSLAATPGDYLGAENDLLEKFGISRPTLRQAAKMVERDRLISVRRGTKGGFFAERPDAKDAIQSLTRFLRLRGTNLGNVMQVTRPVFEEAAAAAAKLRTAADIEQLKEFVSAIDSREDSRELIASEVQLAQQIARISGNPVIELVIEIGYSFGLSERDIGLYGDPERRHRTREMQRSLLNAIIIGDADIARLMMQRRSDQFDEWLQLGGASQEIRT